MMGPEPVIVAERRLLPLPDEVVSRGVLGMAVLAKGKGAALFEGRRNR